MLIRQHVVDSRLESLVHVQSWLDQFYASLEPEHGWIKACRDRLNLAVTEGFTNAVRHAHRQLSADTPIKIEIEYSQHFVRISIWDFGEPFDPDQLEEPEPGSLLSNGGYGWFLLRRIVDHVSYERQNHQNCLVIFHCRSCQDVSNS